MKRVRAPEGTTAISVGKEQYKIDDDGFAEVPDELADHLVASHGFSKGNRNRGMFMAAPMVSDDEDIEEDPDSVMTAHEFSARMSQADMKAFLRSQEVAVPKSGTVGDLRKLVEETYDAHVTKHGVMPDISFGTPSQKANEKDGLKV